jgi:hypothetical protein
MPATSVVPKNASLPVKSPITGIVIGLPLAAAFFDVDAAGLLDDAELPHADASNAAAATTPTTLAVFLMRAELLMRADLPNQYIDSSAN